MGLFSLFGQMVVENLKADMRNAARRAGIRFALGVLVAALLFAAVGFVLAALTVWLSAKFGTVEALLIVAAGMIVLAVLSGVISGQMAGGRRNGRVPPTDNPATRSADDASAGPISGTFLAALTILAAAGIMATRSAKGSKDQDDDSETAV